MFLSIVRDIWETLQKTNSTKQDVVTIYKLKTKVSPAIQGSLSISKYYNYLNGLSLEIDVKILR